MICIGAFGKKGFHKNLLKRKRHEKSQTTKNRILRAKDIQGAFEVCAPEKIEGKCCLLVDDIITTGATLNQCAGALLIAGADKVFAMGIAAPLKDQSE